MLGVTAGGGGARAPVPTPPAESAPVGQMLVLEFKYFCIFSCILTLLIILIKPLTTKAYDRRASGDCGTSGFCTNYLIDQMHK